MSHSSRLPPTPTSRATPLPSGLPSTAAPGSLVGSDSLVPSAVPKRASPFFDDLNLLLWSTPQLSAGERIVAERLRRLEARRVFRRRVTAGLVVAGLVLGAGLAWWVR